jgi:predicted nucleotidyltransferase
MILLCAKELRSPSVDGLSFVRKKYLIVHMKGIWYNLFRKTRMKSGGSWGRLGMNYNLEKKIVDDIVKIAKKNNMEKVILFGSRARGSNSERSDIDLAVRGGDALNFYYDVEEEVRTLLMFDVVDLNKGISEELQREIDRDGVVLYEKV